MCTLGMSKIVRSSCTYICWKCAIIGRPLLFAKVQHEGCSLGGRNRSVKDTSCSCNNSSSSIVSSARSRKHGPLMRIHDVDANLTGMRMSCRWTRAKRQSSAYPLPRPCHPHRTRHLMDFICLANSGSLFLYLSIRSIIWTASIEWSSHSNIRNSVPVSIPCIRREARLTAIRSPRPIANIYAAL